MKSEIVVLVVFGLKLNVLMTIILIGILVQQSGYCCEGAASKF